MKKFKKNFELQFSSKCKCEKNSIVLLFYCSMGHTHTTWNFFDFFFKFDYDPGSWFGFMILIRIHDALDPWSSFLILRKNNFQKNHLPKFQLQQFSKIKFENNSIVLLFYCSMCNIQMTWDLEIFWKKKIIDFFFQIWLWSWFMIMIRIHIPDTDSWWCFDPWSWFWILRKKNSKKIKFNFELWKSLKSFGCGP